MDDKYIENCELLKKNDLKTMVSVLDDYSGFPLESELDRIFAFYKETLSLNKEYGITPSILYFENDARVNAVASKQKEFYIVGIFFGTIVYLNKKFKNNSDLITESGIEEYIAFEKQLESPINKLMYDQALHFTFYHEMAHLIQKSEYLEHQLIESLSAQENFDFKKHICELDADIFASLSIGAHVIQYAKGIFEELTEVELEKILIIMCSSALFYMLSFQGDNSSIYYEEKSHPHPIIRLTIIVFHVVSYSIQILKEDGIEINFKAADIVNKCLNFSETISNKVGNPQQIKNYREIIGTESKNIEEYIKKAQVILNSDSTLASNKWNELAQKLNGIG